jgi:hypothetical protein
MDLTEDDYDALYVVVKEQMPRITREIFPKILAQRVSRRCSGIYQSRIARLWNVKVKHAR